MAKLFLMTGPSGAGKTTLATQLADERGLRFLSIDDFYAAFFGSSSIHIHEDEVWEAFSLAIRAAMVDNIDVLIDTNSPSRADRDWFIERFPDFEFHLVVVDAPRELCILNNSRRKRVIPADELEKIFARIEPVTDDEIKNYITVEFYQNSDNSGVKFVRKISQNAPDSI